MDELEEFKDLDPFADTPTDDLGYWSMENRFDDIVYNERTGQGTKKDKSEYNQIRYPRRLQSQQAEALSIDGLGNRICSAFPEASILKGWKFDVPGEDDTALTDHLQSEDERLNIKRRMAEAGFLANVYRGAIVWMIIDDGRPQYEPLDEANIHRVIDLKVIDATECRPLYESGPQADPLEAPSYEIFNTWIQGNKASFDDKMVQSLTTTLENGNTIVSVHRSRVLRIDTLFVPKEVRRKRDGWGVSKLELVRNSLLNYKNALNVSLAMMNNLSFWLLVEKGMRRPANKDQERRQKQYIAHLKAMVTNHGGLALPEGSELSFPGPNTGGVDNIVTLFRDQLASDAKIGLDVLFDKSSSFLGSKGENERRVWSNSVGEYQKAHWEEPLKKYYRVLMLSAASPTGGVIPEKWEINFVPLFELPVEQIITNKSTELGTLDLMLRMNLMTREEARKTAKSVDPATGLMKWQWNDDDWEVEFGGPGVASTNEEAERRSVELQMAQAERDAEVQERFSEIQLEEAELRLAQLRRQNEAEENVQPSQLVAQQEDLERQQRLAQLQEEQANLEIEQLRQQRRTEIPSEDEQVEAQLESLRQQRRLAQLQAEQAERENILSEAQFEQTLQGGGTPPEEQA